MIRVESPTLVGGHLSYCTGLPIRWDRSELLQCRFVLAAVLASVPNRRNLGNWTTPLVSPLCNCIIDCLYRARQVGISFTSFEACHHVAAAVTPFVICTITITAWRPVILDLNLHSSHPRLLSRPCCDKRLIEGAAGRALARRRRLRRMRSSQESNWRRDQDRRVIKNRWH
jgi:hypothetical protein